MAWENTSTFFERTFVEQNWINSKGQKCFGKGYEFFHEDEYEEISFFVPNHSRRRSDARIVEHTDSILYVWEQFIQTTAYLDFVSEGSDFILKIGKFVLPMKCVEMGTKKVRFHLNTADRDEERERGFVVYSKDIVIDCRLSGSSVEFEQIEAERFVPKIAIKAEAEVSAVF